VMSPLALQAHGAARRFRLAIPPIRLRRTHSTILCLSLIIFIADNGYTFYQRDAIRLRGGAGYRLIYRV